MAKTKTASKQMRSRVARLVSAADSASATVTVSGREAVPVPRNREEARAQMKAIVARHRKSLRALSRL
jgi:hypothetical protein